MDKPLSKGKRISTFISIIIGALILIGLTTTSIFAEDITAEIHVDTPLAEENLDAGQIKITLTGTEFKDDVFNSDNFLLTNAPAGLTVSGVVYESDEYIINLNFDGTDFDSDINDLGLTIKGEELTSDSDLTSSNNLSITATDDPESIAISTTGYITEGNEDGAVITATITGGTFKDSLNIDNWTINNLPSGVTIGNIERKDNQKAHISLSGNSTENYGGDINITLSCTVDEYDDSTGGSILTSDTLTLLDEPTDISSGSTIISKNGKYKLSSGYTGTITIDNNVNTVTIIGDGIQHINTDIIIASRTSPIELTIKDLNIQSPDGSNGIDFGNAGNYDNKLYIDGENHIQGLNNSYDSNQGAGIRVPTGAQLTIDKAPDTTEDSAAVLNAAGGHRGAGIGGGRGNSGGTINIGGGTVTATGGIYGAGIGGGWSGSGGTTGSGGTININGGTVTATGGDFGAGIGGGSMGSGGEVTISGGEVIATSSIAEHIGKGFQNISSGTLKDVEGNNLSYLRFSTTPDAVIKIEGIDNKYRTNEEGLAGAFVLRGSNATYIVSKTGYAAVKNTHDISSGAYNYDINATMNVDNTPPTIDSVTPLDVNQNISSIEIACDDYGIYGTIYLVPKTEVSYTDKASLDGVADKVTEPLESPSTTGIIDTTGLSAEGIYQVYVVDSAENLSSPSEDIHIDTIPPSAPSALDLTTSSDSGVSNADNITNDTTPTIIGTAEVGSTIEITSDKDGVLGTSIADGNGNWSFTPSIDLTEETHSITATATDLAGNTSTTSSAIDITIDTIPPSAPSALDLTTSSDSGVSNADNITNDTTPTIIGTAEAGSTVEITSDKDGVLGISTADGNGNWSFTPSTDLTEETHSITATATDLAGNTSTTSSAIDITIDTIPPAINSLVAHTITDTSISFTWTSEGETDYIYKDESKIVEQSSAIGTYELTDLNPNTQYSFKAKSIDMAGNEGTEEEVLVYTKALNPQDISLSSKTYNSLTFEITHGDNQGVDPEYRLELKLKDAGGGGENKGVSEWSSERARTFDGLSQSTEYELWIQTRNADGLENTKYKANHIFTTSNKPDSSDDDSSSDDNSSSGGGGNNDNATNNTENSPSQENDQIIRAAIESGEKANISLGNTEDGKAQISMEVIREIGNSNQSFTVENEGVSLEFPPMSLITVELNQGAWNNESKLEIGAREVTEGEKEDILQNANMGESTGLFDIGGRIFDLTVNIVDEEGNKTRKSSFNEPVAVTIDLSDMDLTDEDIANLTSIRYERDDEGNIIPVKLGGSYDPETKTFTFYTDKFSLYGVAKSNSLTQITLTIDKLHSEVNGKKITRDTAPTIINNRTMVPIRFIAENMGAKVSWIGEERKVKINLDNKTLELVIDKPIEGFDTPATIVNDRTMVPIRYIAEKLDSNVMWFPRNREVYIVK